LKIKHTEVRKDVAGARVEVITRVEEKRAVDREKGGPELKARDVPLAVLILSHGNLLSRVMNSGLATPPGH
jgi:hypothetical protein